MVPWCWPTLWKKFEAFIVIKLSTGVLLKKGQVGFCRIWPLVMAENREGTANESEIESESVRVDSESEK